MKYNLNLKISYPNNWYINCFPSMASESLNITVYVKSLTGDLIELSVDPEKGLKGVEAALTLFDSDAYAPFQFRCFFIDEEATELTQDAMLGVVAVQEPMARLEEIQENVTLPGTNASYSHIYSKVFRFSLSSPFHSVLYVYVLQKKYMTYFIPSLKPLKTTITSLYWNEYLSVLYHDLIKISFFTIPDAYAVVEVLKKFYPEASTDKIFVTKEDPIYCSCGCIVKQPSMTAHLKTKLKHKNGDQKGKDFLERVADYVQFLEIK